jgi:hypothetical protein
MFESSIGGSSLILPGTDFALPPQSVLTTTMTRGGGGLSELLHHRPAVYFELFSTIDYSLSVGNGTLQPPHPAITSSSFQVFPLYHKLSEPVCSPVVSLPAGWAIRRPSKDIIQPYSTIPPGPASSPGLDYLVGSISDEDDMFSFQAMMSDSNVDNWSAPASTSNIDVSNTLGNDFPEVQNYNSVIRTPSALGNNIWNELGLCGE